MSIVRDGKHCLFQRKHFQLIEDIILDRMLSFYYMIGKLGALD